MFNNVTDEFFQDLLNTFPEERKIRVQHTLFETLCKTNIRKPCYEFMEGIKDYIEPIALKDDHLFEVCEHAFIIKINLRSLWKSCNQITKDVIWRYIHTLIIIGSNVHVLPEEYTGLVNYIKDKMN
jgi:hypothetical protein